MSDLRYWQKSELEKLKADMEEMFDSFVHDFCSPVDLRLLRCDPAVHVASDGSEIVITAQIPNVVPDSLRVSVKDNQLAISGEKVHEHTEEQTHSVTRHQFTSTVHLTCKVAIDQVTASYKDGLLTIRLPKCDGRTPLRITVE